MPLIAFTSPKGGVGKTTIAAHIAAMLRQRGHAVLALDLDPQNALRLHYGVPIAMEQGFMTHLLQSQAWQTDIVKTASGVDLLPFGAMDPHRVIDLLAQISQEPKLLAAPLREMRSLRGVVIVADTPPGSSAMLEALLPLMDMACLVLQADAGSAALIPLVANGQVFGIGTLAGRYYERTGVVVNQVQPGQRLSAAAMDCAVRALGDRLLGAICRDDTLAEALAHKRLLSEDDGRAAEDLALLTDQIVMRLRLKLPGSVASGPEAGAFAAFSDWGLR